MQTPFFVSEDLIGSSQASQECTVYSRVMSRSLSRFSGEKQFVVDWSRQIRLCSIATRGDVAVGSH